MPAENELARDYDVSRMTIRKVLGFLSDEGQVVKLPQRGIWVPENAESETQSGDEAALGTGGGVGGLTIAAVWSAEPDVHIVRMCEGIKRYTREHEPDLHLFLAPYGGEKALGVLRRVEDYSVDGVIVMPRADEGYISALGHLIDKEFPVVCIDRVVGELSVSSVEVDNAGGMYQATHHLIDKLHRPVYFLANAIEYDVQRNRRLGYCRAMDDAGYGSLTDRYTCLTEIKESDPSYWPADKKWMSGFIAAEKLLDSVQPPVSVVCINDYIARGVYEKAGKRGLAIGSDVAVVGFDDLPLAKVVKPPLTTIRQPREQIGYHAARLLHRLILGRAKPPVHVTLPVELVIRESA